MVRPTEIALHEELTSKVSKRGRGMQSVKEPQRSTLPDSTPVNSVGAQVERIVASSGFATSERHTKLLRHLVSMSLAGRGGEIKEYALGVDLFGRA